MNNKYILCLESYVYIKRNPNKILIYNTLNNSKIIISNNCRAFDIINRLINNSNCYSVKINESELRELTAEKFIDNLENSYSGKIITIKDNILDPFSFIPKLHINDDGQKRLNGYSSGGKNICNYLNEIIFFLNTNCSYNCSFCSYGFKQSYCCNESHSENLKFKDLVQFIKSINKEVILTFAAGNILNYKHLKDLLDFISITGNNIRFLTNYKVFLQNITKVERLKEKYRFQSLILIPGKIKDEHLTLLEKRLNDKTFLFILKSEEEVNDVWDQVEKLNLKDYILQIIVSNSMDYQLFKESLLLNEDEISDTDIKSIYKNQVINSYSFGKLLMDQAGRIYSNLNSNVLAKIPHYNINEIIAKELLQKDGWFFTRNKIEPCSNCVYQDLCPPISDHERFNDFYKLCHVIQ
ncbi:MAG: TIGR04150 pseudo-rSAM protein [Candidatus Odinarchaeota archaeon]